MKIRAARKTDFTEIYQLNKDAFEQADEAKLVNLLRDSDAYIPELSLVAVSDNQIVGYILFTRIKILSPNKCEFNSLALAPMAVKPEFQKQGIGGKLIRYGLDKARDLGFKSVIVLGHENYYPKFGFLPASNWKITTAFEVPENALMAIELVPNGLKNIKGIVKYAKEFELL